MTAAEDLTIHDLGWSAAGRRIVDSITATARRGQLTGLLGPNGSGKTTLLRLVARLLPPATGSVQLIGRELETIPRRDLAKALALVEQQASTDADLRILDVVLLGRIPHQRALQSETAQDRRIAMTALARVDMAHLADRSWQTCSGGERQRAQLARALTQQPQMLLLDEPTNHLDVGHQLQLLHLVRETRLTTVAALHDLNLAAMFCDHLLVLDQGRIVADGDVRSVLTAELIEAVYRVRCEIGEHPRTGRPFVMLHPPTK